MITEDVILAALGMCSADLPDLEDILYSLAKYPRFAATFADCINERMEEGE